MTTKKPEAGNKTPAVGAAAEKITPMGDSDLTLPTVNTVSADSVLGGVQGGPVLQDGESSEALQSVGTTSMASALGGRALDRPMMVSSTRDVHESQAPMRSLQLSDIDKKLEELRRTDLQLEPVNDLMYFADHAEALSFNEEWLIINIHESADPSAENPLPLRVNGVAVAVPRGQDCLVRRKYVELLMRMKPQTVSTRIDRSDPDNIKNFIEKRSSLLNPFSIIRDDNKRSRAWVKKVMSEV